MAILDQFFIGDVEYRIVGTQLTWDCIVVEYREKAGSRGENESESASGEWVETDTDLVSLLMYRNMELKGTLKSVRRVIEEFVGPTGDSERDENNGY